MGLSIAVAGGIICVTVLAIFSIVFSLSGQVYEINSSRTQDASQDGSISQTNFDIQYLDGDSGGDLVSFMLYGTGNEKLWDYEKFTVIVTYNASILASPVLTAETLEYNSDEAFAEAGSGQFLRPDGDISNEGWDDPNGNNDDLMWNDIEEATRNDADYVETSTLNGGNPTDTLQIRLSNVTDPQSSIDHFVKYTYRKSGPGTINLTVQLMQGLTEIASWTHLAIGTSFVQADQTLTALEADSITNYNDLRLIFTGTHVASSGNVHVSWAEMEIPNSGNVYDCSPAAISAGQWTIDSISSDNHDPKIINTNEGGRICVKLSNNIHTGSYIIPTVSTDVGRTVSDSVLSN